MVHNVYMFNLVFFISQNKSKESQNVSYSVDMSQIHCAVLDMYPHSFVENSFEMTFQWYHFVAVGVKVLRDCGVQTAEVDTFSDPQGIRKVYLIWIAVYESARMMYFVLMHKPFHD